MWKFKRQQFHVFSTTVEFDEPSSAAEGMSEEIKKQLQVDERMLGLNDGCSKLWRPSRSLAQGQPWFVWFGTGIAGVWLITAYLNIHDTEVVKIVEVPKKRARSRKTAVIKSSLQCNEEIKAPGFKINTEMNFSVVTSKIILS